MLMALYIPDKSRHDRSLTDEYWTMLFHSPADTDTISSFYFMIPALADLSDRGTITTSLAAEHEANTDDTAGKPNGLAGTYKMVRVRA